MYRMLTHRGVVNYIMRTIWGSRIPLKLKVFLWLIIQDRLQTGVNLKRKKWKGNYKCLVCGHSRNLRPHLLHMRSGKVQVDMHQRGVGMGTSTNENSRLHGNWVRMGDKNAKLIIFYLAIILWGLWNTRNKCAIEGIYLSKQTEILFKINLWLQRWRVLLKREEKAILDEKIKMMDDSLKGFIHERRNQPVSDSFM